MNILAVALAETVQLLERAHGFNKPLANIWSNHNGMVFLVLVVAAQSEGANPSVRQKLAALLASRAFWRNATLLSLLYLGINIFWAAGLPLASVAVATVVTQACPAFVYALSVLFLRTPPRPAPAAAVLACLAGVALIALASRPADAAGEPGAPRTTVAGVLCMTAYTLGYAVYQIVFKRILGDAVAPVPLYLTGIGIVNLVALWPVLAAASALGWEAWATPNATQLSLLALNMTIATTQNALIMLGLSVTDPLFISVGSVLQIPLAVTADLFLHGTVPSPLQAAGSGLVVAAFLALNIDMARAPPGGPPGFTPLSADTAQPASPDSLLARDRVVPVAPDAQRPSVQSTASLVRHPLPPSSGQDGAPLRASAAAATDV